MVSNLKPFARTRMGLWIRMHERDSWHFVRWVAESESENFAYPVILVDENQDLHVFYTENRLAIRHQVYSYAEWRSWSRGL